MMEPRVASLSSDFTVQQATAAIRKTPREALHYLYVTNRDGKLAGVINMRDLLLASPRDPIQPLVRTSLLTVPDTMSSKEVVQKMREKRFLALPVVDFEGRLVGVVKQADALRAGQDTAFDDMQKIVGAGADERALSPVSLVVKSRLPWLYVNLVTAFMAAAVIGVFEGIIAQVAALAVLLPVVAGQGGNTGSQSLAVVMRGLALREICARHETTIDYERTDRRSDQRRCRGDRNGARRFRLAHHCWRCHDGGIRLGTRDRNGDDCEHGRGGDFRCGHPIDPASMRA